MEDRRDLFPLYAVGASKYTVNKNSSRARKRNSKRQLTKNATKKMACALNYLSRSDPYYVQALRGNLPSSKTTRSHAAQEQVLEYLERRSLEAWRRGFLGPRESADKLELEAYATRVGSQEPLLLDPKGDLISLPKRGLAASVDMLGELSPEDRELYSGDSILRQPNPEELASTPKCLMVKKGEYFKLVAKLVGVGVMELVKQKPKEINGLFGVSKDNGTKQRLILDARRANLHFVTPGDPKLPHPGLITQLHNHDKKELVVGKIDIDNFYHRIALPDHLKTYFVLPKIKLWGRTFWPQMRSIPMGWSHSVIISQL